MKFGIAMEKHALNLSLKKMSTVFIMKFFIEFDENNLPKIR